MISWLGYAIGLIVTLVVTSCTARKENFCPTEEITVRDGTRLYNVVWKSNADNSVIISKPPCYNEKGNLMVRRCVLGVWITANNSKCYSIEKSAICPLNYVEEDKACTYLTEPRVFQKTCPFRGASSVIKASYNGAWLPVERKVQYGPFEYILPSEHYGLQYFEQDSSEYFEDTLLPTSKNCMAKTIKGPEIVDCNSLYSHVCSYKYNHFLYKCPDNCVPGGLGSNYCFCKVISHQLEKSIGEVCKAVASPKYSYERDIILKLVGSDTCIVADVQENSILGSFDIDNALSLVIHRNEWGFQNSGTLNCVVCTVNAIPYPSVDLKLKFNAKSSKLQLNVYSPEGLLKFGEEEAVYCFTDATGTLRTRVEIEEMWDSHFDSYSGRRLQVFKVSIVDRLPGNYWCEVFQLPYNAFLIKSNTVVAYKNLKGQEYSLRLQINNFCRFSLIADCAVPSIAGINALGKILFHDRFFSRFIKKVRLFHIYKIDKTAKTLDVLLHLSTETKLPFVAEYAMVKKNLKLLVLKSAFVIFFKSSWVCLPDITVSGNSVLNWKSSSIGKVTVPKEFCVQESGEPVRRKCKGDFVFGSEWANVEGTCSQRYKISSKTEHLRSLLYSDLASILPKNISDIMDRPSELTVLDLYYLSEALAKVSSGIEKDPAEYISEISNIVDELIAVNRTTLKESQVLLNSTDELLDNFEDKLLSVNTSGDIFLMKKRNLVIQVTKPFINNISGFALYGKEGAPFSDFQVVEVYSNTSLLHFIHDDRLEVAVYVPEKLLHVLAQNASPETQKDFAIVTKVYYRDSLFNTGFDEDNIVVSRVVSVTLSGYGDFLQSPIPILLRTAKKRNRSKKPECAFWNYGTASESFSGYWSTLGGDYLGSLDNSSLELCSFSHLTNFGLLVRNGNYRREENNSEIFESSSEKSHNHILTVISDIGCIFSAFGIAGIFLTSIVFQSWREKIGTRILNQLCIALLLQIIFLNIATVDASTAELSKGFCAVIGIVLHYVTIAEFSWMLVAAVLQFFRFVRVIGPMPNRIILKAMLVGWGVPLIPVILVGIADLQCYSVRVRGICYPEGLTMYVGVLLPIALIVTANMVVFVAVIRNVFVLRIEVRGNSNAILKRQICLAVLLFFLLGLPWTFGLLSGIINYDSIFSYVFLYLFCLTATLQGFVLFVFYVVLDKSTRSLWLTLFKTLCNNRLCR